MSRTTSRFHLRVFKAARNNTLEEILKNVQSLLKDNQSVVIHQSPTIVPRSIDYHGRIFAAIRDGYSDAAQEIMREHMIDIEKEMHSILRNGRLST